MTWSIVLAFAEGVPRIPKFPERLDRAYAVPRRSEADYQSTIPLLFHHYTTRQHGWWHRKLEHYRLGLGCRCLSWSLKLPSLPSPTRPSTRVTRGIFTGAAPVAVSRRPHHHLQYPQPCLPFVSEPAAALASGYCCAPVCLQLPFESAWCTCGWHEHRTGLRWAPEITDSCRDGLEGRIRRASIDRVRWGCPSGIPLGSCSWDSHVACRARGTAAGGKWYL